VTVSCRCMKVSSDVSCSVIDLIVRKHVSFVCLFGLYFYRGTKKTVSCRCMTVLSDISCPVCYMDTGLFCKDIGLFCMDIGLFCMDMHLVSANDSFE